MADYRKMYYLLCKTVDDVIDPLEHIPLAVPYALGAMGMALCTVGFWLNAAFYLVFLCGWFAAFRRWLPAGLPQTMGTLLLGMERLIETGEEIYPLREAMQDTYLFLMMDEAIRTGKAVRTSPQVWQED